MLAKALQTEIIFKNGIAPRKPDMDQDNDKHPNPSHIGGLTKEEGRMLCQAKENLLQAQEALRLAQRTYDALASLRPLRIIPSRR